MYFLILQIRCTPMFFILLLFLPLFSHSPVIKVEEGFAHQLLQFRILGGAFNIPAQDAEQTGNAGRCPSILNGLDFFHRWRRQFAFHKDDIPFLVQQVLMERMRFLQVILLVLHPSDAAEAIIENPFLRAAPLRRELDFLKNIRVFHPGVGTA